MTVSDEWLTRTAQNTLAGPFTKQEIIQKVMSGQLALQDEVCRANEYWFYLHEAEEVAKYLGIQVPRPKVEKDAERTNTETQGPPAPAGAPPEERTDPDLEPPAASGPSPSGGEPPRAASARAREPEAQAAAPAVAASSARAPEPEPRPVAASVPRAEDLASEMPNGFGTRMERPMLFQGMAWALVLAIGAVIVYVLKLLKQ